MRTREDWKRRRGELRELILEHEYGRIPSEAKLVVAATKMRSYSDSALGATIEYVTLDVGNEGTATVPLVLTVPDGEGPFPILITGDLCWGRVASSIVATVVKRGYMLAELDRTALAADGPDRGQGVLPLYPAADWGGVGVGL